MAVTIHDVARRAQVSVSTVSRAFTMPELVRPATREQILRAADELGYRPNRAARGLLEVIDGHPPGTASRVHGPDEPAAPTLAARPDRPLDQIRHLIVQAGTACTHLAAIAPDGPAARQATEIIGLLTQVRDLAAGRHAHDAAGSSVNRSAAAAATLAAAGFPCPPLSAEPGADGASARQPDTSHPGQQQVPPGTQGRHQ